MKKITKLLTALVFAASALFMSGCSDELKDALGPNGVWCVMEETSGLSEYTSGTGEDAKTSKMVYYFKYVDAENLFSIVALPEKHTIDSEKSVIENAFNAAVNGSNGTNYRGYLLKEFKGKKALNEDGTEDSSTTINFAMNQITWSAFYQAKLKKSSFPSSDCKQIEKDALTDDLKSLFDISTMLDKLEDKIISTLDK